MPLGANERAAFRQAVRWVNEGIDSQKPRKLPDALARFRKWRATALFLSTPLRSLRKR